MAMVPSVLVESRTWRWSINQCATTRKSKVHLVAGVHSHRRSSKDAQGPRRISVCEEQDSFQTVFPFASFPLSRLQEVMAASTAQPSFKVHIKINHVEFATLLSENGVGISYHDQTIRNLVSAQLRMLDIGIEVEKGLISLLEDIRVTMGVVEEKELPDRRDLYELSKDVRKVADDVRSLVCSIQEIDVGGRLQTLAHQNRAAALLEHIQKTQTDLRAFRKSLRPTNRQGNTIPKECGEMTEAWRRTIQAFCGRRGGVQKYGKTIATESKDRDIRRGSQGTPRAPTETGHATSISLLGTSTCRYAFKEGGLPSRGFETQTLGWVRESWTPSRPVPAVVTSSHVLDLRMRGHGEV